MLRVIKQKANDGLLDSAATNSESDNRKRIPLLEPTTTSNLVSHVPSCVSLGGSVPSSNSSVASEKPLAEVEKFKAMGDAVVSNGLSKISLTQPLQRDSRSDESRTDSCPKVSGDGKSIAGSRKVSFSQSDLGCGVVVDSGPNPKRPRLDSFSSVSTPVMMPIAAESRLLTMSDDANVLNPLHLFIRAQIEVFTATPADIALPAPGRKVSIA